MRTRLVLVVALAVSALTNGSVVHAGPSLVTQSQSFVMTGDAQVFRTHDIYQQTKTIGLEFSGTPGSVVIAGEPAYLTSVSFDLTTELFYMINVNAQDYTWFSDCYTEAGYGLSLSVIYPDQSRLLYSDHKVPVTVHGESWFSGSLAYYHKEVNESPGQSFTLSADDDDLSLLDVDKFTVEVQRDLLMCLFDWDTNDNWNLIALHKFRWEGDLTISYQYEDAPVPTPVPIPSATLLLCSGLVGLVGFRRHVTEGNERRPSEN